MESSHIFSITSSFVLVGWILLMFAPHWKHTIPLIAKGTILLLSLVYAFLVLPTLFHFDPSAFSTLENVRTLFKDDWALTAGWIHYLAFDLFVGTYIAEKSKELQIARWQCILCLLFTLMFGPIGLILFYIFKWFKLYFPKNQRTSNI